MSQAARHISRSLRTPGRLMTTSTHTRIHFRGLTTSTTTKSSRCLPQDLTQHQSLHIQQQKHIRGFVTSPTMAQEQSPAHEEPAQDSPTSKKDWSASQYLRFSNERTRPVHDLLSQVLPHITSSCPRIYDLGCGPGNSTRVLLDAFPSARITGLDSSSDMLTKANAEFEGEGKVDFIQGNLENFEVKEGENPDLVFSNAAFHWLRSPTRLSTISRLFSSLSPGGVLAIQVPDNYHKPTHRMMRKTALVHHQPWSRYFADAKIGDLNDKHRPDLDPIEPGHEWYDMLNPHAENINIWRTTYSHILPSQAAIVEWVKGTGLQPFLHRIGDDEKAKEAFLAEYQSRLEKTYPGLSDGNVMLSYPRLFVVAVRK